MNREPERRAARGKLVLFRRLLIVCLFSLGIAFAIAQQDQHYVILPQSEAEALVGIKLLGLSSKVTGTWQPTQSDVAGPEANLHQVSDFPRSNFAWERIEHPEKYFRQYLGLAEGPRKLIYLSAYCGEGNGQAPGYWREHLFEIDDGGSCVWQALYDVSSRKFIGLRVNGLA